MAKAKTQSRKDSRGYALRTGECQRCDGRYSYSYTDVEHNRHTIYASDLPELREKEKLIMRDQIDGLDPLSAQKLTLNDMYDRYISTKYNLKETTKANYTYMYNHFVRPTFGKRTLASIKYTDIKRFYYGLLESGEVKANTLDNIHTQIHPALQLAVREEIIRNNPSNEVMAEIKRSNLWVKPKRHALTVPQQKKFLDFVRDDREFHGWYPIVTVLLGTGMRIGECLGLRWEDVNFEERYISVNHNLTDKVNSKGRFERHISTPKTEAGTRTIPMVDEVFDAFLLEYEFQKVLGFCQQEIDGYSGFIFSTADGTVYLAAAVNHALHRATKACNEKERKEAKEEHRDPIIIPDFSAHHLRHTFCTRLCENESNLKVIQSIMGHKDISTTMDIYADCTQEKKQETIANLQGKIIF